MLALEAHRSLQAEAQVSVFFFARRWGNYWSEQLHRLYLHVKIFAFVERFARRSVDSPRCVHPPFARNKVPSAEMIKLQAGNRKHINFTLTL